MQYEIILKEALAIAKNRKGLCRKEVAEKSGVSINSIDRWLKCQSEPSIHLLTAVVNACGLQLNLGLSNL